MKLAVPGLGHTRMLGLAGVFFAALVCVDMLLTTIREGTNEGGPLMKSVLCSALGVLTGIIARLEGNILLPA